MDIGLQASAFSSLRALGFNFSEAILIAASAAPPRKDTLSPTPLPQAGEGARSAGEGKSLPRRAAQKSFCRLG